ncbi:MAG: T9SS type A sorting domain-containing protein [Bacteroidales bacterium]|nr:T9SS type A sorting domain-containing protein [Bacteroidales bacterium]
MKEHKMLPVGILFSAVMICLASGLSANTPLTPWADAPTVTTQAATLVISSAATLNGTANPNGDATTAYFRYSTSNPGTSNDSFGTRAPSSSSSDTNLGSGTTAVPFSRALSGLLPGTTYYYCAIAKNSLGTSFGEIMTFTTPPAAPYTTTNAASSLTGTMATLNGAANPMGASTTGWFRIATASPGTGNDSFGTRIPASGGTDLGTGKSNVPYSIMAVGLTPGTTYYYCAISENSVGKTYGTVLSFTTPTVPAVTTNAASSVSATSASLNGTAIPNGAASTGYFRFSATNPGTPDDSFGTRAPASGGSSLGSGYSAIAYSQNIFGLSPGTTYYYWAVTTNIVGTSFGAIMSFTTHDAPAVTTISATTVTSSSATLNGSGIPNGSGSYGYFRYGTTNPVTASDTYGTRAPSSSSSDSYLGTGTAAVLYSRSLSGLSPATTYYYYAVARNSYGTSFGEIMSFTTPPSPPTATTNAPESMTGTSAQLKGTSNPGGATTTGWFRIATASPGTGNDTFGTRIPASGGTDLGAGTVNVSYTIEAAGLTPGTTYYYCAITENSVGKTIGAIVSFVTPSVPAVTTNEASTITSTSAYFNGTANPNGAASTGYFRFSVTNPGTPDDSFGTRAPVSGGSSLGSGYSAIAYSQYISGLSPGTTYYYWAVTTNIVGTSFGAIMSFTTPDAPAVTTSTATLVISTSATLNGTAIPNRAATTAYFRYSTTNPGTPNDSFGTRAPSSSSSDTYLGSGTSEVPFSRALTGLLPGTTYYYCAIASNSYGTSFGDIMTFTTEGVSVITWSNPADIDHTTPLSSTQLNATANVDGTFTYTPPAGTKLSVGDAQPLKVDFMPTDAANWAPASKTVYINVYHSTAISDAATGAVMIYPNPATGAFTVSGIEGEATVTVTDLNGKVLLKREVPNEGQVSVTALEDGIYIVRINHLNGVARLKLVKKR